MQFTNWANENTFILAIVLSTLLLIGLRLGYARGGWNRHMVYLWTLIVFIPYLLLSPLYFWSYGRTSIVGTEISRYYGTHFFYACLSVGSFIIGYWLISSKQTNWISEPKFTFPNSEKWLTYTFYGTYGIVMLNMAAGGINVANVFLGQEVVGLGAQGASYYLQNFADSLITVLILGYLFGVRKNKLLVWIGLSFFLFFLLGFRYRIVLSLAGLMVAYLYKHKLSSKQIVFGTLFSVFCLYMIVFSTMNRKAMITRQYDKLEYNPFNFQADGFFEQTRGSLADMAIYKLYDDPTRVVAHDYGATIFAYVFIRMIPRFVYPNKDEFYPPPQIDIQFKAYFAWWAKFSGEACLSSGAIYVAWGWAGMVLAYLIWAMLLKKFSNTIRVKDPLSVIAYIVVALASFQWITRGYFPQAVDHFAYLMAPVWLLRYLRKKKGHANN